MKSSRWATAVILSASITLSSGVALYASPTCRTLAHTVTRKIVPNRVSKKVSAAWIAWGKEHPGWKPKPGSKPRPKTKTIVFEQARWDELACSLFDTQSKPLTGELEPIIFDIPAVALPAFSAAPPPVELIGPPEVQQAVETADSEEYPPSYAGGGWYGGGFSPGLPGRHHRHHRRATPPGSPQPPTDVPVAPSPVPEPSTLAMVGTAAAVLCGKKKSRRGHVVHWLLKATSIRTACGVMLTHKVKVSTSADAPDCMACRQYIGDLRGANTPIQHV